MSYYNDMEQPYSNSQ